MRGWLAVLLASLLGGAFVTGNRLHRAGDFAEAEAAYRRALAAGDSGADVRYNLGTSVLRQGRFTDARPILERAAALSDGGAGDPALRLRAHFNAGNADLEPAWADSTLPAPVRAAAAQRAVVRYRRALLADPGDADAKWNLELALRLLDGAEGGGGEDETPQGGGGDDPDAPQPAAPQTSPQSARDGGERPEVTRAEAERILGAAERAEREVQRQRLRRAPTAERVARDW